MNKRLRRVSLPAAGFIAGLVLAPAAAVAATASFSSSSGTPAVSATNTTAAGPAITATAKGSGNQAAVLARNYAASPGSNAFYSKSYVNTGEHYGIWGVDTSPDGAGVRGQSTNSDGTGVVGEGGNNGIGMLGASRDGIGVAGASETGAGVVGSGAIGVASDGEIANFFHLLDFSANAGTSGDLAGTVSVVDGAKTARVTYPDAFSKGITPVVVLTPTSQGAAASSYWVAPVVDATTGDTTGFDVNTAAAVTGATFDYVVVGFVEPGSTAPAAKTGRITMLHTQRAARR
jgi:hypothetical protein